MEIKGTAVLAIRNFVINRYEDKFSEWIDSMPLESKEIFEGKIDKSKWYPLLDGGITPTRKIGELFFSNNFNEAALESGKFSAQSALEGISNMIKISSPANIIKRIPKIFSTYYRPGQLEVLNREKNHVTLQISDMTDNNTVIEHRIAGWMLKAMELSGAKHIKILFTKSMAKGDTVTQMDLHWDKTVKANEHSANR